MLRDASTAVQIIFAIQTRHRFWQPEKGDGNIQQALWLAWPSRSFRFDEKRLKASIEFSSADPPTWKTFETGSTINELNNLVNGLASGSGCGGILGMFVGATASTIPPALASSYFASVDAHSVVFPPIRVGVKGIALKTY
jgi:hypothetical protein